MLMRIPADAELEPYFELLLLADESESQVRSSMHHGDLYAWHVGNAAVGVVLAIPAPDGSVELRAVAVSPEAQGKGIGSTMLRHVLGVLQEQGVRRVRVGTGNSSIGQLAFYQKAGFRLERIERDYFSPERGCAAGIEENGIPLRDMVWMDLEL